LGLEEIKRGQSMVETRGEAYWACSTDRVLLRRGGGRFGLGDPLGLNARDYSFAGEDASRRG